MLDKNAIETILRTMYVDIERANSFEKRNEIFAYYAEKIVALDDSEIISLSEAAEILGVSRQRVHVLLQNGQLDGFKVGNSWNVYRESVENRLSDR